MQAKLAARLEDNGEKRHPNISVEGASDDDDEYRGS